MRDAKNSHGLHLQIVFANARPLRESRIECLKMERCAADARYYPRSTVVGLSNASSGNSSGYTSLLFWYPRIAPANFKARSRSWPVKRGGVILAALGIRVWDWIWIECYLGSRPSLEVLCIFLRYFPRDPTFCGQWSWLYVKKR